jgi:hypothetical protein
MHPLAPGNGLAPDAKIASVWHPLVEELADGRPTRLRTLADQLRRGLWWQVPPAAPLVIAAFRSSRTRPKRKPSEDKFRFAEWFYFRKIRQLQ